MTHVSSFSNFVMLYHVILWKHKIIFNIHRVRPRYVSKLLLRGTHAMYLLFHTIDFPLRMIYSILLFMFQTTLIKLLSLKGVMTVYVV